METIQVPSSQPSQDQNDQEIVKETTKHGERGRILGLLLLAMLFGLVGGILSPYTQRVYDQQIKNRGESAEETKLREEKIRVVAEDNVVADLVEKNSAGVVSIIITKDVPRARSFFDSPFGGFPFFTIPEQVPQSEDNDRQIGSGSGFFISADGLIVTNKHVVADEAAKYTVLTRNKEEYTATVLARDPNNDIAILKVEGQNFPALTLGDSDRVRVGETAIAIGNPLGEFANSVSRGIVSGLQRSFDASGGFGESERLSGIIQTDAAINPGNSGGPLFNLSGEVIGVNVAIAQGAQSIGFALPINQVKNDIDQVKTSGKISVPYIGVRYVLVNEAIKENNNLTFDYGALILRGQTMSDLAVIPGSPADKAGLKENDIILEMNGAKISAENPLANEISKFKVGDEVTLKIWEKGKTKDVKIRLEERK